MSRHASFASRALRQARLAATKRWDPVRTINYFGTELRVPWSSDMPYFHRHLREYSMSIPAAAQVAGEENPTTLMIDIGANVGDTAVLMRAAAPNPILCVDGEPDFYDLLKSNVAELSDIHTVCAMVGPTDSTSGVTLRQRNGSAHVVSADEGVPMRSLASLAAEFPHARLGLVKTDTDGFDAAILTGASSALKDDRPIVHWEYYPELVTRFNPDGPTCLSTMRDLGSIGYSTAVYYDNLGGLIGIVDLSDTDRVERLDEEVRHSIDRYYDVVMTPEHELAERVVSTSSVIAARLRSR